MRPIRTSDMSPRAAAPRGESHVAGTRTPCSSGPDAAARRGESVGDLERRLASRERGGGAEHEAQGAGGAALLPDHVPEIFLPHPQLETRLPANLEDVDLDLVGVVDQPAREERHQIAEL